MVKRGNACLQCVVCEVLLKKIMFSDCKNILLLETIFKKLIIFFLETVFHYYLVKAADTGSNYLLTELKVP